MLHHLVCALLCGAEGFVEMEEIGKSPTRLAAPTARTVQRTPATTPSGESLPRSIRAVYPGFHAFGPRACARRCPANRRARWQDPAPQPRGRTKPRASGQRMGGSNRLVLGHEVTAVPEGLWRLELAGCIVALDAMGCQIKRRATSTRPMRITCSLSKPTTKCFTRSLKPLDDALRLSRAPARSQPPANRGKRPRADRERALSVQRQTRLARPTATNGRRCAASRW